MWYKNGGFAKRWSATLPAGSVGIAAKRIYYLIVWTSDGFEGKKGVGEVLKNGLKVTGFRIFRWPSAKPKRGKVSVWNWFWLKSCGPVIRCQSGCAHTGAMQDENLCYNRNHSSFLAELAINNKGEKE